MGFVCIGIICFDFDIVYVLPTVNGIGGQGPWVVVQAAMRTSSFSSSNKNEEFSYLLLQIKQLPSYRILLYRSRAYSIHVNSIRLPAAENKVMV